MKNIIKKTYIKLIAFIYFIVFTTPILSPAINGFTIYLYWFIPFLDIYFIAYIYNMFKQKIKTKYILAVFLVVLCSIILEEYILLIKILTLVIMIWYLKYCKENKTFKYLYYGVNFNIIIAIIQFTLCYISIDLAYKFGPTYVSKLLWGDLATTSFTNFYVIFSLVRVSGWSREAGFFASLIIITFIHYIYDKDMKKNKLQYILFVIGFIISFSKISFLMLLLIPTLVFRKQIKKIPYFLGIVILTLTMIGISNIMEKKGLYTFENITYIYRIGGYSVLQDLNVQEFAFGVDTIDELNSNIYYNHPYLYNLYLDKEASIFMEINFSGIAELIIHNGFICFIVIILSFYLIKFDFFDFLIIFLNTITVSFFTSTSFVILGYFLVVYIKQNDLKQKEEKGIKSKEQCDIF